MRDGPQYGQYGDLWHLCYTRGMSQSSSPQVLSPSALAMVAQRCKVARDQVRVVPIEGASTGCRRAVALAETQSVFVKEADPEASNHAALAAALSKDDAVIRALQQAGSPLVTEFVQYDDERVIMLSQAYIAKDGWQWQPPDAADTPASQRYIAAVLRAITQLEQTQLPKAADETLGLHATAFDRVVQCQGLRLLCDDATRREELQQTYRSWAEQASKPVIRQRYEQFCAVLDNTERLADLAMLAQQVADQPCDRLSHGDVRSETIAYHAAQDDVKLIDWQWAAYVPKRWSATEFLLDMARRGYDVQAWQAELNRPLLAGLVGYYAVCSAQPAPEAAQAVRRLQAYMAATAYDMLGYE